MCIRDRNRPLLDCALTCRLDGLGPLKFLRMRSRTLMFAIGPKRTKVGFLILCTAYTAVRAIWSVRDEIRPGFFRNLTIALFCGLSYLSINIREGENHAGNTASAYRVFDSVAGIDQPFYCSNSYWARWCRGRATGR